MSSLVGLQFETWEQFSSYDPALAGMETIFASCPIIIYHDMAVESETVAPLVGHRTCDSQVVGLSPG